MMLKKMCLTVVVVALVAAAGAQAATVYVDENFDALTTQVASVAADVGADALVSNTSNYTAEVVDTGILTGAGDKAMRLNDNNDNALVKVTYDTTAAITGSGRLLMDFHMVNSGDKIMEIVLREGATLGVRFKIAGTVIKSSIGGTWTNFDQSVTLDTDSALIIDFDSGTDTFSGSINGTTLTTGGGGASSFDFANALASVDNLYMLAATSPALSTDVYVDNIKIVPEPATMGLLGIGGLMTLLRKRRK